MSSQAPEPISLDRSTIVRAGAGAGKTTALTEQVLNIAKEFLKTHDRYPRIVVTTFTKKATQELKERLVLLALKKENELLEFVNSSSILKISTIHGILDQYLRQYGSFLKLDPSFSVINSSLASQLARQAIRRILLTHPEKELLQDLIDDFSFSRLEKLCREYYRFKLQYPDLAPQDLHSLERLTEAHVQGLTAHMDELVCAIQFEAKNPKWLEFASQMSILSNEMKTRKWSESFDFFKNIFEFFPRVAISKNSGIGEDTNEFKKELHQRLRALFSDECFQPSCQQQFADKFVVCQKLFEAFSVEFLKVKLQSAAIEINDLELMSLKLSREFPATSKAFSDEWDYWLIDEYQDTSPVQVELIQQLSQEKPQYVVGDPQQSIYLFRGARSEVFQNRESEIISRDGLKLEKLHNYRSRPELLEFFNDFFKKFEIPFSAMIANQLEVASTDIDRRLVAKFYIAEKNEESDFELLAVAEHILSLIKKNIKLEEICILARTNKTLNDISKVLAEFSLPHHVHISSGFYQRREVQDALALYKFLVHPHNNLNLMILLRSPWFLIDDQFLIDYLNTKNLKSTDSYWRSLSQAQDAPLSIQNLKSCLERVEAIGIAQGFLESIISIGILDFSKHYDQSGRVESNVWKLVSLLREQEKKPGFNPLDLIAQIESDVRADQDSEGDAVTTIEPERINLMTIHASKGLQFRHVIIPRLQKKPRAPVEPDFLFDDFDSRWSMKIPFGPEEKFESSLAEKNFVEKTKKNEIAEHARVLYVAMTRAIDSVFLSWTLPVEKNSWAEMIHWNLDPGIHQSELYSYEVLSASPNVMAYHSSTSKTLVPRPQFSVLDLNSSATQNLSVTELLDQQNVVKESHQENWFEHFKVVSHGSLTHKLMQAIKYSSNIEVLVDRWFQNQKGEVLKALDFIRSIDEPPLIELIQKGHVEMGFSYREGSTIIDGQIDLWGISNDVVWIVDYKTGSIRYCEKAFVQLDYYAKALRRSNMLSGIKKIKLAVIYPFSEKVFTREINV